MCPIEGKSAALGGWMQPDSGAASRETGYDAASGQIGCAIFTKGVILTGAGRNLPVGAEACLWISVQLGPPIIFR